jgi:hypothetical protein
MSGGSMEHAPTNERDERERIGITEVVEHHPWCSPWARRGRVSGCLGDSNVRARG